MSGILMRVGTLLVLLAACSSPRLVSYKPDMSDFRRDSYQCKQESRVSWGGGGSGAMGGLMILAAKHDAEQQSRAIYRECMEVRGYTVTEE